MPSVCCIITDKINYYVYVVQNFILCNFLGMLQFLQTLLNCEYSWENKRVSQTKLIVPQQLFF